MAERLLVVIPNWVGDVVMATPALAALRSARPDAHIAYLLRRHLSEVVAGGGGHDAEHYWPVGGGPRREWAQLTLVRALRSERYDAALLLTNSFRSALLVRLAGIPRRIGFARDGRGWLLNERLTAQRERGEFVPTPVTVSYCEIVERYGVPVPPAGRTLRLGIPLDQEASGRQLLAAHGLEPRRYALLVPGAEFGAAKCWLPERFAETCDHLLDLGLRPVLAGAPKELPLLESIAAVGRVRPLICRDPGTTLGSLKVLVREAAVMVCNDTGPRSYARAFDTPCVTIFGPTHQAWTDTIGGREVRIQAQVPCGPCQLRVCPLDHACMRAITPDDVLRQVARLVS